MSLKALRKHSFTLIEICIALSILLTLTSYFSYLGYDTIKEYRKRNGRSALKNTLIYLHHENALRENNLMLLITQKGDTIETTLGGNTTGLNLKKKSSTYFTGKIFSKDGTYAIKILPRTLPSDDKLASWVESNDCILQFYED